MANNNCSISKDIQEYPTEGSLTVFLVRSMAELGADLGESHYIAETVCNDSGEDGACPNE